MLFRSRHKSIDSSYNYERLEFLGDAILDGAVSKHIFDVYKELSEGELTQLRSRLVKRKNLNRIGRDLELGKVIKSTFAITEIPDNIYGNVLEALIGAIFLDRGEDEAVNFINKTILKGLSDDLLEDIDNFKGLLLEWGNKMNKSVVFETKPDGYAFQSFVCIEDIVISDAKGKNKKQAEQVAAKNALNKLEIYP